VIFEWNSSKAAAYVKKHGVSFEDAATVFSDPLAITREAGNPVGAEAI
jgi:uncharacterized DUF497 family protein